jgi:hypothetical protein
MTTNENRCTCMMPPRPVLAHPGGVRGDCGHVYWWPGDHRFEVGVSTAGDREELFEVGIARYEDGDGGVHGPLEVHLLIRRTGNDENTVHETRMSPVEARAVAGLLLEKARAVEFLAEQAQIESGAIHAV